MFLPLKLIFYTVKKNFIYLFLCVVTFIVGIICGVFFKSDVQSQLYYENILNRYIIVIDCEFSVLSYALPKLISSFCILLFVTLSGLTLFTVPFHFLIMLLQGYLLAIVFPHLIAIFTVNGVVLYIFLVLPCALLRFISVGLLSLLLYDKSINCKSYKKKGSVFVHRPFCCLVGTFGGPPLAFHTSCSQNHHKE